MNEEFNLQYNPGNLKSAMSGVKSGDLWKVPFDRLVLRDGFNVRVHDAAYHAHIRWIADSIKENGFHVDQPFGVFIDGDEIVVHAGHCRHAAVTLAISEGASISEVPCVSVPRGTSAEDLTVALHTSNGGKALTPLELGIVCKRLVRFGWDEKKIASRLALSVSYIGQLLSLMEAPVELRGMVQAGKIAAGTAIDLIKKHGVGAVTAANSAIGRAEAEAREKGCDAGTVKATAKHLDPEAKFNRMVKKQAVPMFEALKDMRNDPGFRRLNGETQQKIQAVLDEMDKVL